MAVGMGSEGMVLTTLILTSGASGRILGFFNALLLLLLYLFPTTTMRLASWKSTSTWTSSRRALAIRRVLEDADSDGTTFREYHLFSTSRCDTIFTQSWIPRSPSNTIRGLVILMHGLNEHRYLPTCFLFPLIPISFTFYSSIFSHSGRYTHFAKHLNANGFKVYGMDWLGKTLLQFNFIIFSLLTFTAILNQSIFHFPIPRLLLFKFAILHHSCF